MAIAGFRLHRFPRIMIEMVNQAVREQTGLDSCRIRQQGMACHQAKITAVLDQVSPQAQQHSAAKKLWSFRRLLVAVRREIESLLCPLVGRDYELW
jgi:hypothetical protein